MEGKPEAWAAAVRSVDEPEKLGALADRLLLAEGIVAVDDDEPRDAAHGDSEGAKTGI